MQVGAKQLRTETANIIKRVSKGEEVTLTYRGKAIGVIRPVVQKEKGQEDRAFGIWSDRDDVKDVNKWIVEKRRPRYKR